MKVCIIKHHEKDTPGLIGQALEARGARLQTVMVEKGVILPDLVGLDAVVILGAAWSVYDRQMVGDWIDQEVGWVREADRVGLPTLGICFGAQVMTTAMGGRVESMGSLEMGWHKAGTKDSRALADGPYLEFHGDHCLIPAGVEVLAQNQQCLQAFRRGGSLGVQFHPEVDPPLLASWLEDGGRKVVVAAGVDPEQFMEETELHQPEARSRAQAIVDLFLQEFGSRRSNS